MSRLLNKTRHNRSNLIYIISPIQNFKRLNSTSSVTLNNDIPSIANQNLITDLLKYAKERIIEPEPKEISLRPRYKRLTIDESHLSAEEIINSTDNYLTTNDFMLGKVLPVNLVQSGIDILHDYMPYWGEL